MNLLEMICNELGVKLNEEWQGNDGEFYKITRTGIEVLFPEYVKSEYLIPSRWIHSTVDTYNSILTGQLKPVWKPKEGDCYYIPFLDSIEEMWAVEKWEDAVYDNIIFKTKEEAIECANKMLEAIKEEK